MNFKYLFNKTSAVILLVLVTITSGVGYVYSKYKPTESPTNNLSNSNIQNNGKDVPQKATV